MPRYIISYSLKKGPPIDPNYPEWKPGAFGYYGKVRVFNLTNKIVNPWKIKGLRKLDGRSELVQEYIKRCEYSSNFINVYLSHIKYNDLLFGCYGGRHRSVAIAEMVAAKARERYPEMEIVVIHRDLEDSLKKKTKKVKEAVSEETATT